MDTTNSCVFCEIAAGARAAHVVYDTPGVMAFLDGYRQPADPAHVLVIPRTHVENLYGISDALGGELFAAHARIARAVKKAFAPDGITTWSSNEPAGGQEVLHYHLHVFPRGTGVPLTEVAYRELPEEPVPDDVLASSATRVRTALASLEK